MKTPRIGTQPTATRFGRVLIRILPPPPMSRARTRISDGDGLGAYNLSACTLVNTPTVAALWKFTLNPCRKNVNCGSVSAGRLRFARA